MFNDPQLYASPHSDGACPTEAEPQSSDNVSGIKNQSTLLGAVSNEENCIEKLSNEVILNDSGNNALSHAPINRVNLIDKSPLCVSKQLPDLNKNSGLLNSENVSGVIEKDETTCSNDQSVNPIIKNVEQTTSQREDELNRLRNEITMLKLQLKNRPTNIRESRRYYLSKGSTPCPFLMRRGWCAKGNRCDFLHAKSPTQSFGEQKNRVPCPFLKRRGYCLKGNVCDFSHDDSPPNVPVSWHNYSTSPFFFNHRGPMNLGPQGM